MKVLHRIDDEFGYAVLCESHIIGCNYMVVVWDDNRLPEAHSFNAYADAEEYFAWRMNVGMPALDLTTA